MPAARKLSDPVIASRMLDVPDWRLADGVLRRELRFRDFSEAFAFMTRVALLAEQRDHHPDWSNGYATVRIDLHTHDAGGLTELDFELAAAIDRLLESK